MGFVHAEICLKNPRAAEAAGLTVRALVDTGANHLCLPAALVEQLGLETNSIRTVTADGVSHQCRYVGPVTVRFENRECFVGALELGTQVLLGAIPIEDMDLVVNPSRQSLTVNPDHPLTAHAFAMGNHAS